LFFFPAQESPQQSQHFRKEKQLQQQDMPQQAHRIIHQRMEKTMRPPIIIMTMTGHLQIVSKASGQRERARGSGPEGGGTNLQYVACMQLLQLENEFLTLETSPMMLLACLFLSRPSNTISATPLLTLLRIAVSMEGILGTVARM
jgi:hypothetical protein